MQIGQVAQSTGDTIRFYEKEGLVHAPPRSSGGYRVYDDRDVERFQFVSLRCEITGRRPERWAVSQIPPGKLSCQVTQDVCAESGYIPVDGPMSDLFQQSKYVQRTYPRL
jgi:hypothetical protein